MGCVNKIPHTELLNLPACCCHLLVTLHDKVLWLFPTTNTPASILNMREKVWIELSRDRQLTVVFMWKCHSLRLGESMHIKKTTFFWIYNQKSDFRHAQATSYYRAIILCTQHHFHVHTRSFSLAPDDYFRVWTQDNFMWRVGLRSSSCLTVRWILLL